MSVEKEKYNLETYGTEYPVCGNCEHIREIAGKLMCEQHKKFRDFDDVKCIAYSFSQHMKLMTIKH